MSTKLTQFSAPCDEAEQCPQGEIYRQNFQNLMNLCATIFIFSVVILFRYLFTDMANVICEMYIFSSDLHQERQVQRTVQQLLCQPLWRGGWGDVDGSSDNTIYRSYQLTNTEMRLHAIK